MTKNMWLRVAGALAVTSIATVAIAADHGDSPGVMGTEAPADINDVYSFVDNGKVALVMTVYPDAPSDAKFSDKTQYIFHTTSGASFNEAKASLDIVCTFDANQMITCLAGKGAGQPVVDKVTGDASVDAGVDSVNGKIKVYAGLRKDPFFFNLDGFKDVVSTVKMVGAALQYDMAGCPMLDNQTSALLVGKLKDDPSTPVPDNDAKDHFADFNALSIVLSVDAALLTEGGKVMSVWGSTNKAM